MPEPSAPASAAQSPSLSAVLDAPPAVSRASTLPIPSTNESQLPLPISDVPLRPPSRISITHSAASSHDDVHTGRTWARTVDDPWLPLVLTLDGGGIRGYTSLIILQRLMEEVAVWETRLEAQEKPSGHARQVFKAEELQPCLYFDFMYGTSTGGLIATMLGRLRMTVPSCLEVYRKVGNELFGKKRNTLPLGTKYYNEPLEEAVKRIVKEHCPVHKDDEECGGMDWNPWSLDDDGTDLDPDNPFYADSPDRICQSICLTAVHNSSITTAYLLRTYNHRYYADVPLFVTRYNEGAEKLRIWQTTRATSAAPFFFKAMVADVGGERKEFKDGGIRENNPSVAAWNEIISLYGENRNPALLLSIGTGRPNMEKDGFASVWPGPFGRLSVVKKFAETFAVFKNMLVKYTEGEGRHEAMAHLARGEHTWYKRLNVSQGLENMRLDNWEKSTEVDPITKKSRQVPGGKSLKRMEEATHLYLSRSADAKLKEYAAPKVMLQQIAEKLVRHRRARERTARYDPDRWASFTGKKLRDYRKPKVVPVDSGTGTGAQASMESSEEIQPIPNGTVSAPSGTMDDHTTDVTGFSSQLGTELSSSQHHEGENQPPSAVVDTTDFAPKMQHSNPELSTSAGASLSH